jgi:F-type H+-transporting ATPase subunit epsilon
MRLVVTTPRRLVLDRDGVDAVRAEDASGGFGILSGHADLMTVLPPSILSYRDAEAAEHYVGLVGGVLVVRGGDQVMVASPEAMTGDDLDVLEAMIIEFSSRASEEEQQVRTDSTRLHIAAIRHIQSYIEAGRDGGSGGMS